MAQKLLATTSVFPRIAILVLFKLQTYNFIYEPVKYSRNTSILDFRQYTQEFLKSESGLKIFSL